MQTVLEHGLYQKTMGVTFARVINVLKRLYIAVVVSRDLIWGRKRYKGVLESKI